MTKRDEAYKERENLRVDPKRMCVRMCAADKDLLRASMDKYKQQHPDKEPEIGKYQSEKTVDNHFDPKVG